MREAILASPDDLEKILDDYNRQNAEQARKNHDDKRFAQAKVAGNFPEKLAAELAPDTSGLVGKECEPSACQLRYNRRKQRKA